MKLHRMFLLLTITILTTQCQHHKEAKKQVVSEANDNSKYIIIFDKTAPVNDSSDIGINWKVEKPVAEFDLEGSNKLTYRFTLLNDTIAVLSQKVNDAWKEQDKFEFQPWRWIITDTEVASQFEIKDFDKDGDEDLLCWVMSNINGNEWTYIYLNDGSKLVKLYDTAEDSFFWFAPKYDEKKATFKSQYYGSAYGHDFESLYKLEGTNAIPLSKYYEERSGKEIRDDYYKGVKGKWKLVKTETEKVTEE